MSELVETLKSGGRVVTKTDTIYGILALASNKKLVESVYDIKGRDQDKPFIILIPETSALKQFGIELEGAALDLANKSWPGPVTIIFDLNEEKIEEFSYLHRGSNSLAFRVPDDEFLLGILEETGPLIAPSANPQGVSPAEDIDQAKEYFSDMIDTYYDRGKDVGTKASKIVKVNQASIDVIRK